MSFAIVFIELLSFVIFTATSTKNDRIDNQCVRIDLFLVVVGW